MSAELPRTFDAHATAARLAPQWEADGLYTADPSAPGPAFSIVIPPPNVTGSLHMGHALNNTLQDVLVRYKRMDGYNVLWVPGMDHAGIATQWVVERQLRAQGIERTEMAREDFVARVWDWKQESGGQIQHQLRQLGVSCDWSRERFTMDEGLSRAVREVFVRLYEEGLIYRAERLINWDPVGRTALSDLEVEAEEGFATEIWRFAYPLEEEGPQGQREIVVATTRPETMLGDTAVAVHPDDPRYRELIGRFVVHPILGRRIPIIGDAILVDPEFGTGAVKVTPAHDFNDFEVGKRHDLPMLTILELDGTINEQGGPFQGLSVAEARQAVKARIAELGLDRGSSPHTMALPRSQRSGAVVEPMLSTQWFVRMAPLAQPALAAVEHGFTRFVPKGWENTYFAWLRDIKDWCISRQLWWGHQIPAWTAPDGRVLVGRSEAEVRAKAGLAEDVPLVQDPDVLDTWFSSALWPFSTMGWPEKTADLARYYPTSVLITGFDIIFFWVARMMFMGQHFMGQVPFKDVYIHALVRDEQGQKMSKTKGNVVDPLDVIGRIGPDAFRFTLVAMAAQGRDVLWSEARAEGYLKFQNKIWQAFRFTMGHLEGFDPGAPRQLSAYDEWIRARLDRAVAGVRAALDDYRFNEAAAELYQFTWSELCDWYLELCKGTLYDADPAREAARNGARATLLHVFDVLARLLHPFMPFLSAELWERLPVVDGPRGSIVRAAYPRPSTEAASDAVLAELRYLQEVIGAVRRVRADMEISPRVGFSLRTGSPERLRGHEQALRDLCRVESVQRGGAGGAAATIVVQGEELYIPLEGVVDLEAERARLEKELQRVEKDLSSLEARLANPGFTERAPPEVVAEFRGKLDAAQARRESLRRARMALGPA